VITFDDRPGDTFARGITPAVTGTPGRPRELVASQGVEVLDLRPGETTE